MRIHFLLLTSLAILIGPGCAPHRQTIPPPPPVPVEQPAPENLRSRVEGTWERTTREQKGGRMIFRPDGTLVFEGALESYNPGQWTLDSYRNELTLILPQAQDASIAVFQLYLKEGVKALDRSGKRVIYTFTNETESLNVAGWIYNRPGQSAVPSHAREAIE